MNPLAFFNTKIVPYLVPFFLVFLPVFSLAQSNAAHEIHLKKTMERVQNRRPSEGEWQKAQQVSGFWRNFPNDTAFAATHTAVQMLFDDTYIYVRAECDDDLPGNVVYQTLKRDFSITNTDCFAMAIDPSADKINGFNFSVSAANTQREGIISNGGADGVTTIWDNVWYSDVTFLEKKWIVYMAIPFKSIRYDAKNTRWGVNFARQDLKRNEQSAWSAVPRGLNLSNLAYEGVLIWDDPLPKQTANIALNPYATASAVVTDYTKSGEVRAKWNAGIDAKIGVSTALNLDLTINPDFSQVEVDRQVTNLERFSVFFPERRTFFTENADILSSLGTENVRPFFSRNIGLYNGNAVAIAAGARLSGKIDKKTRIYALTMQTLSDSILKLNGQNYSVVAAQRNLFSNSNLTLFGINKQGFDKKLEWQNTDFNRMMGAEFQYVSRNSRWTNKTLAHRVFNTKDSPNAFVIGNTMSHFGKNAYGNAGLEYVGSEFTPAVGFVPRLAQYNVDTKATQRLAYAYANVTGGYLFFEKNKTSKILSYAPELTTKLYFNDKIDVLTDKYVQLRGILNWRNGNSARLFYQNYETLLRFSSRIGINTLPADRYFYQTLGASISTNARKTLFGSIEMNKGTYYAADFWNYKADINYRIQPWGAFGLTAEQSILSYNTLKYKPEQVASFGAKAEISFHQNLFLTTFAQYNTQQQRFNLNSRLQWRFRPLSDLYLVYTDNYETTVFAPQNRALVLKLNYWW
jgi:Domain of unknown function (DUF5916)/Carbohydrate family 9 binding domain-like